MTAAYRAKFTTLLGDALLDELPLSGVSLETRLGAAGAMSASIPIARGDYATGRRIAAIKASGATAVTVYRNGAPWWGGPLWTKTPTKDQLGDPSVALQAATYESYPDRVQLNTDLTPLLATDQISILRSLVDHMQADPNANIGLTYDPALLSGVLRDRTQYLASARDSYLKMWSDLAACNGGFEFTIQVLADPTTGARTRNLRIGYPTLGGATHRIDAPGAILSYSLPEDGTRGATCLMAQGSSILSTLHTDTAALAAGYPRLDATTNYSSVTDPATLEAHATADLAAAKVPVIVPTMRIRLDAAPDLTPQSLGDTIKAYIKDELYPDGATFTYRLVGMKVSPPEKGKPEYADLTLN